MLLALLYGGFEAARVRLLRFLTLGSVVNAAPVRHPFSIGSAQVSCSQVALSPDYLQAYSVWEVDFSLFPPFSLSPR